MFRFTFLIARLACIFCWPSSAKCQFYFYNDDYYDSAVTWELGFYAGGMNCLTDLGGRKGVGKRFIKDINWNGTRICGGLYAGATYQRAVGLRLEFSLGQVTANDNVLKNDGSASYGRMMRNLSFRSGIAEASLLLELHPLQITGNFTNAVSPYFLGGIGYFGFSPQAYFNNTWIMLSGLHTEGQGFLEYKDRKAYKLAQLNLPLGLGIRYEVSPVITLRFETVYRKLWTDYLDDVSKTYINKAVFDHYLSPPQAALARALADRRLTPDPAHESEANSKRGNEKDNDAYFSFNLKIGVVLGRQKRI